MAAGLTADLALAALTSMRPRSRGSIDGWGPSSRASSGT